MPKIAIEVEENHESMTRPIVHSVIDKIRSMTQMPKVDVIYKGDAIRPKQTGSAMNFSGENNTFPAGAKLIVEATEEFVEDVTTSTAVKYRENVAVFADSDLGILIKPVYSKVRMAIQFDFRTRDRNDAQRWRNTIRRKFHEGFQITVHELTYHYPVPVVMLAMLYQIHAYRENVEPYGEDLDTWMKACLNDRATTLFNQAGEKPSMVIPETQIAAQGWFDFDAQPEQLNKEEEAGQWTVGFTYNLEFDRVISCVMEYPLMVHNQMLHSGITDRSSPYKLEDIHNVPSWSRHVLDDLSKHLPNRHLAATTGLSIPFYDDWLPISLPNFQFPIIRMMLQLNPEDKTELVNLEEMGDYALYSTLVDYLKANPESATLLGDSPIHLSLYKGRSVCPTPISMDALLNVTADGELQLRSNYHLMISLIADPSTLSKRCHERLRNSPEMGLLYLSTLAPELVEKGLLPKVVGGRLLSKTAYYDCVEYIARNVVRSYNRKRGFMNTVGSFVVQATRHED